MKSRSVILALLAMITTLFSTSAYAKRQRWEVTYPDGKKETFQYDDSSCQMVGWQRKINLSASFDILKRYQGSAGFNLTTDHQRQLDTLETDFGLQFESLCKDYMMGVYKDRAALYDCRKGNISNALTDLRQLNLLLSTVSSNDDAAKKKDEVSAILDKYAQHVNDKCTGNALQSQTDTLTFGSNEVEKSVDLTNIGYFDISWSAAQVPVGFFAYPPGGPLPRNNSSTVKLLRLAGHTAPPPRSFFINDNQSDQLTIHVNISGDDAIQNMKGQVGALLSKPMTDQDAVEKAAAVVRNFYKGASDDVVYWISGQLLNQTGDSTAASRSFSKASEANPTLEDHPQFKLDVATASLLTGDIDSARKSVGEFLSNRAVATQKTYQLEKPEFYQHLYSQLGDPASTTALTNSLKASGYNLHTAVQ